MGSEADTVLVVGASGFLGRALCDRPCRGLQRISAVRTPHPASEGRDIYRMDITDAAQVASVIGSVRPDWVINAAAETGVDRCEADPARARAVHVEGTRNLIRACEDTGCGLVTISTNYVFDGLEGPYGEADPPNPLSVYGRTKLEAEACALEAGCPSIVVRTAVLYGYREGCRPNFVTWALRALARREPIRVVNDEWANPTWVDELAGFLLGLCRQDFRGLIHFAGADYLTRYEMVQRICGRFDLDMDLVTPVTSAELGQQARRPLRAGLKLDRLRALFNPELASFEANLGRLRAAVGDPAAL